MKNYVSDTTNCIGRARTYVVLHLLITAVTLLPAGESKESNNPDPRWGHTFIYDPFHKQILLFGGARKQGSYLDDTWIWDGTEWHRKNVVSPTARGFCGAAIHEERKTIILHGGRGNQRVTYSDTWEWTGTDWKQLESQSTFAADHHQMVYVASDNVILA
ncbi:hypothetical protein GWO43_10720 [candidate division KSB1 bacterium]|nr:hypothetical protein [candidate division KSB1 bacterium]NIR70010.1 hypothetical protein [candidate division KSB1 bacterium]NIS24409.1 hypothetical protein [candidate division KSB1 bacterium]NIT71344.1 hypothetical protein [candidate division KSB1 bacterium]NIU25024.1 hypothetical protein [candidate division KSB1 bacterium]